MKNPLRYPGGKSKLYEYINSLLAVENLRGCDFYEPFAGSAALSILLLNNNVIKKAIINEKDPLIFHFWKSVFDNTDELITLIQDTDITVEKWKELSKYRNDDFLEDKTSVQIGFAGLFLNRTNFSGILKANPLGGMKQKSQYTIDCRFNKSKTIKSIQEISLLKDRIEVCGLDALDFMKSQLHYKRNHTFFVYIDPPYYKEGPGLYRHFYTHEDHVKLSKFIMPKAYPWLISYDDTPEIRKMYIKKNLINLYLDYSVRTTRKGPEVLISNLKIPPIVTSKEIERVAIGND